MTPRAHPYGAHTLSFGADVALTLNIYEDVAAFMGRQRRPSVTEPHPGSSN